MRLAMVGIIVKDMEKAITFYECLGLGVKQRYGDQYVELANETIRISLNTATMVGGMYGFEPSISGERLELAFELDTRVELEACCSKIEKHGYKVLKAPWDAPWGQYYALIEDADGNILSLFVEKK